MKPKVKVCGITTQEDAVLAESLGADFIGFIFFQKSPRFVGADRAADIVSHTRGIVKPVGVFVEEDFEAVKYAVERVGLSVVQLHGAQSAEFELRLKEALGVEIWRAAWLDSPQDLEDIAASASDKILVDSRLNGLTGGTGMRANWKLAAELSARRRIVLAGGIGPDNVKEAVAKVNPWCIDVNSGVEISAGRKSKSKLKEFFERI